MLSNFVGLRRRDRDTTTKSGRRGKENSDRTETSTTSDSKSKTGSKHGVNSSSTTTSTSSTSSTTTRRVSQQQQEGQNDKSRIWRSAVDAKTGRTYYYDVLTRETQWRKPIELATNEERLAMERKEQKQKEFFAAMEDNILRNLAHGSYSPVLLKPSEDEERDGLGQLKVAIDTPVVSGDASKVIKKPSRSVRTISSMDQHVLAELTRVEKENLQLPISSSSKNNHVDVSPTSVIIMASNSIFDFGDSNLNTINSADSATVSSSSSDDEEEKERAIAEVERVAKAMAELDDLSQSTPDSKESRNENSSSSSPVVNGKLNKPALRKRNTCSTLYVGSTMSAPDKDATIKCICGVYRAHILQAVSGDSSTTKKASFEEYDIFRDVPYSGRKDRVPATAIPSLDDITSFFREVFVKAQMESDCIIMSLIYVERLIKETNGGVQPHPNNWHSVLFSCMILASKVWDDLSMWNADFSHCTRDSGVRFSLQRINELEKAMLSCLKYNVKVLASEYAKYYFFLRSMLIRSGLGGKDLNALAPLDIEGARQMQLKSASAERKQNLTTECDKLSSVSSLLDKPRNRRSKSLGNEVRVVYGSQESELKSTGAQGCSPACVRAQLEQIVHM